MLSCSFLVANLESIKYFVRTTQTGYDKGKCPELFVLSALGSHLRRQRRQERCDGMFSLCPHVEHRFAHCHAHRPPEVVVVVVVVVVSDSST